MEIEWSLDRKDSLLYYVKTARGIQNRFYQNIRAIILPYLDERGWYLPDYGLFENKEFLTLLEKVDRDTFVIEDQRLLDMVDRVFDLPVSKELITNDKREFEEVITQFLDLCKNFFPSFTYLSSIKIVPVRFGTTTSYFVKEKDSVKDVEMTITYRLDCGYKHALQSILSELIWIGLQFDELHYNQWMVHRAISEFIVSHTAFSKFFDITEGMRTLDFLDDYKGELFEESARYYAKMGFPIESAFSYLEDTILYNQKPIIGLSNKEIEVMKLLIDRKSHLVSFDDVADMYWGKDSDEYSLEALAKVIERIRKTLEQNGISDTFIKTVRKRGYLLFD